MKKKIILGWSNPLIRFMALFKTVSINNCNNCYFSREYVCYGERCMTVTLTYSQLYKVHTHTLKSHTHV